MVLVGQSSNGPPEEITITLASQSAAPRIARGPQQSSEDPFSWKSRQFLRELCIGKNVKFTIVSCVASINRTSYGDVILLDSDSREVNSNLAKTVVRASGWSSVKESVSRGNKKSSYSC